MKPFYLIAPCARGLPCYHSGD